MNIANLGVVVDPTQAQSGASAVDQAIADMAAKVVASVGKVEDSVNKMSKDVVAAMRNAAQAGGAASDTASKQVKANVDNMKSMVEVYQSLAKAAALLATTLGLGAVIKEGIQFNSILQDSVTSIAAVQLQFHPEKFQNMADAMGAAAGAVEDLKNKATQSPASFQALVQGFQATAGAAAKANLTMQQHVNLVVLLSQAFKALNIPEQQMVSEMRALITGNINQDSDAAKMLGITREDVARATQTGQLFDFLTGKMSAFAVAGDAASTNLSTLMSNVGDKLQQIFAGVAKPAFEALSVQMDKFLSSLGNGGIESAMSGIGAAVASLITSLGELTRFLAEHLDAVIAIIKYYGIFWLTMKAIQFGSFIAGLVASTVAFTATGTAAEIAAAKTARYASAKNLVAGAVTVGAFAAGGGTGVAIGAGVGSFFGPWGTAAGAAAGLLYDKTIGAYLETQKQMLAQVEATVEQGKKEMDGMRQKVGLAQTDIEQTKVKIQLQAKLAELAQEIPRAEGAAAGTAIDSPQNKRLNDLLSQKATYNYLSQDRLLGATAQDAKDTSAYEKAAQARFDAVRREIDLADDLNKKTQAKLDLDKQIADTQQKIATAPKVNDTTSLQKQAAIDFLKVLEETKKKFDDIAGTRQIEAKDLADQKQQMEEAKRILGDQLSIAQAKLANDQATVSKLEDQKRQNELLKALNVDITTAKKAQRDYTQQIVDAERALKDLAAQRSFVELNNTNNLRNIRNKYAIAPAGETQQGQRERQSASASAELAELQRQYAAQQAYSAQQITAAGVPGVPSAPTASQVLALQNAATGVAGSAGALQLLQGSFEKLSSLEQAIIAAMGIVADSAKKIASTVPTDASIMQGFHDKIAEMQKLGLDPTELSRRRSDLEENVVGSLAKPTDYSEDLGKWRTYQAEKVRIAKDSETKMQAGAMTTSEAFSYGAKKAADAWGNFDTQVAAAGEHMMNVLSDGLGSAITDVITGTKTASEAFGDMARSIITSLIGVIVKLLIQLAIQMAINAANGRSTNYNVPSIINFVTGLKFASGGHVNGGRGGIDDVPAWLTAGEYVINRDSARAIGLDELDRMNTAGRYASGGLVGRAPSGANRGGGGGDNITSHVSVNVQAAGTDDSESEKERAARLGKSIDAAVLVAISREKKQGGALYR